MTQGFGYQGTHVQQGGYNHLDFIVQQFMSRVSTMKLVKITKVEIPGGLAPAGVVHVQPLVNQIDGSGNKQEHGVVHKLQYFRMQAGKFAIIADPKEGDIGLAIVADRDSSAAIKAKGIANPGSNRRFSMADGVYIGGALNGTPDHYIQAMDDGVRIGSKTKAGTYVSDDLQVSVTTDKIVLGNPADPLLKRVMLEGGVLAKYVFAKPQ